MIELLSSFIIRITLSFYEPLGACIFAIPLKKRRRHFLYGFLSIILYYLLAFFLAYFKVIWFAQLILKFIGLGFIIFSISESNWKDCIYAAVWSNTSHMLMFNCICTLRTLNFFSAIRLSSFFAQSTPIYILGYIIVYFLFVPRICPEDKYNVDTKHMLIAVLTTLPFTIFNNIIVLGNSYKDQSLVSFYCCIFSCLCCMFVLSIVRTSALNAQIHQDYHLLQQLLMQRQLQYELTRENIDIINQKCHDLKHQINMLKELPSSEAREEYIKEVSNSIMIYDSVFHTGNEVLDTLLTEKSLFCMRYGITIKCIADGQCLDFMDPIDLYSLLGNAIDNAFESVLNLKDEDLRMINIYVKTELNFIAITIENYVEKHPKLINGIPQTTKEDKHNHGYGIKSMQYTTKKYNGQMTVNIEHSMFIVRFLFPQNR